MADSINYDFIAEKLRKKIAESRDMLNGMRAGDAADSEAEMDEDEQGIADSHMRRDRLTRIQSSLSLRIRSWETVLARIEAHDPGFGYCEECGEAIVIERILSVPETRFCASCASEKEEMRR